MHFIGGGRITKIFLNLFELEKINLNKLSVYDIHPQNLEKLESMFHHVSVSTDISEGTETADLIFIALHPPVIIENLLKIKNLIKKDAIVCSLAPKISIEKISETLGQHDNIIRMIPNAPSIEGNGFNPVSYSDKIDSDHIAAFERIALKFGFMPNVSETKLEAYAVISGMGPTYFWFQLYKLRELGVSFGLTDKEAREAVSYMVKGTLSTMSGTLKKEEVLDLIPVKPLADHEAEILSWYEQNLTALYNKLKY